MRVLLLAIALAAPLHPPKPPPVVDAGTALPLVSNGGISIYNDGGSWGLYVDAGASASTVCAGGTTNGLACFSGSGLSFDAGASFTGALSASNLSGTNTGDQTKTCSSLSFVSTLAAGTSSTCSAVPCAGAGVSGALCDSSGVLYADAGIAAAKASFGAGGFSTDGGGTFTGPSGSVGWQFSTVGIKACFGPGTNCCSSTGGVTTCTDVWAPASISTGAINATTMNGTSQKVTSYLWTTGTLAFGASGIDAASSTLPTIASGFGTSPTITGNGTVTFRIVIGTAPGSTGVLTMPASFRGWNCDCGDLTTKSATVAHCKQIGVGTTTAVTLGEFDTTITAANWVAADVVWAHCWEM